MKKKIILMLLILLSIAYAGGGGNLSAQEPEIESSGTWGGIDWTLTTDGTLTIAPTDNEITKIKPWSETNPKELYQRGEWPAAVNDAISAITGWPYNRSKVKRLIIEEGVTSIGSFAAQNFSNLTGEVVIPSTVAYIGQEAFQNTPIDILTFTQGGTEELCIAPGAFKKLNIETLEFPGDRPVHIHCWAFNDCPKLEHVILPASITGFYGQNHLDYMPSYSGSGDSQIFKGCNSINTMVFLSEEVKNRFYSAAGNQSNINAIGGVTEVIQGDVSLNVVQIGVNHITLSWGDVDGATGYNVYQGEDLVSAAQTETTFTVNNLTKETKYNFTIEAIIEGEEPAPAKVSATTKAPAIPAAEATQIGVDHITLSWNAVDYAIGYNVYIGDEIISESQTETTFSVYDLDPNTEYCFKVSTVYDIDESDKKEICATTRSLAAKVNETEYETIDEAIDNWTDGTTLTLLADVILSDAITFNSDETRTLEFSTLTMTAPNGKNAFIIPENSTITLNNGKLTQNSGFVISTSGTLTLQDMTITGTVEYLGGEMFTNTSFNVSAKKSFTGVGTNPTQNWSTISTPIANAEIPTGTHDLYRFNEPEQEWEYYDDEDNMFATLDLGRGYLYANESDITLELEGAINIGDVVFPLSYTEYNDLAGFNMVGNPFTYNITDNNFETEATLAEGFYTLGNNGEWIPNTTGTTITPMESVLIKANMGADLTIRNGSVSKRTRDDNKHFAIMVSDNNYQDIAYVVFNDGLGLNKIEHRNADVPMIYIPLEGNDYAVATIEKGMEEMPLSFRAGKLGEYTIAADARECRFEELTLVDRFTGAETNLLIEDYSFMARTDDNPNRFFIRINSMNNGDNDSNFVYINNDNIIINNIEGQGTLRIYDVMGRNIAEYNVYENANISSEYMESGMYIIQMTDNSGVKVQKIIID